MDDLIRSVVDVDELMKMSPFTFDMFPNAIHNTFNMMLPNPIIENVSNYDDNDVDGKLVEASYMIDLESNNTSEVNNYISDIGYKYQEKMSSNDVLTFYNEDKNEYSIVHRGTQYKSVELVKDIISSGLFLVFTYNTPHVKKRAKVTEEIIKHIVSNTNFTNTVNYENNKRETFTVNLIGYAYGGYTVSYTFISLPQSVRNQINQVTTINTLTNLFAPLGGMLSGEIKDEYLKKVTHKRISGNVLSAPLLYFSQNAKIITYRSKEMRKSNLPNVNLLNKVNVVENFKTLSSMKLSELIYSPETFKTTMRNVFD